MFNSLAYQYVLMAIMVAHANFLARHFELDEPNPIRAEDIVARDGSAFIPAFGFIGYIATPKYKYGFSHSGSRIIITKLEDGRYQSMGLYRGSRSMKDFMDQFSQIRSALNTNDALRLATNWLAGIDIDLTRLQKEQPLRVEQQFSRSDHGVEVPCPLFYVRWGKEGKDENDHPNVPNIEIMISGINGELLHLNIDDDSYAKHSFNLIKNVDDLLAIPDADFLKYSSEERNNLVVRFSAMNDFSTNALVHTNTLPIAK